MTQTFIGMEMSQEWDDIGIWEVFFRENEVKTLIELGTDNGGLTLYFSLQCYQRKIYFHTFDNQKWIDFTQGLPKYLMLENIFHHVDLFSDEGRQQVTELIETLPHPIAIFFDNGDKPREWKQFAHLLSPGDFAIVHDWGKEFTQKDLGDVKVERILTNVSDKRPDIRWRAMWFRIL